MGKKHSMTPDILCIGSVLWDIIGRSPTPMRLGSDVPGRITRLPGGVAMNIAMTLARLGLRPAVLTAIGRDPEGDALVTAAEALGVDCRYAYRPEDLPTDRYMAIEAANGLVAAIADAHSLEAAGNAILAPLVEGRLSGPGQPWRGVVVLDCNLTGELLNEIAQSPLFTHADIRIASAATGKAERLWSVLRMENATLYLNKTEAALLTERSFEGSQEAALALLELGARRVIVTDGPDTCTEASRDQPMLSARPPQVVMKRITGAGDTFMGAHIRAELDGADRQTAMFRALDAAAQYVAGVDEE